MPLLKSGVYFDPRYRTYYATSGQPRVREDGGSMKYRVFLTGLVVSAACAWAQAPAPTPKTPETTPTLRDLSESLQQLSRHVRTSVVQIFSTGYAAVEDADGSANAAALLNKQHSTGSGVILSADGYIVTNSHVVRGARRIQVRLPPAETELAGKRPTSAEGRLVDAKLVGQDKESDLAVIHIDRANLPHLIFGNSEDLKQGELVMAFGNPLGLEGSVSMGVVSSTSRQIKPDSSMIYIQTDAPINPGNSGGPLIDADGRVVGINTFIFTQSGGSEGLGFAVPSNVVKNVYDQIRKEGHVHRGKIGVSAQTITQPIAAGLGLSGDFGVIVSDVDPA